MDDCISRAGIIAEYDRQHQGPPGGARKIMETFPSADVRPVVLCLHCKHWDTSWAPNCGKEYGHFCPMVGTVTYADWFCADGEKREESL